MIIQREKEHVEHFYKDNKYVSVKSFITIK